MKPELVDVVVEGMKNLQSNCGESTCCAFSDKEEQNARCDLCARNKLNNNPSIRFKDNFLTMAQRWGY
jgi:hypothetical protein